jgi:hypothetical protein
MHSALKLEDAPEIAGQRGSRSAADGSSRVHRETILMWCIGTAFGAAMITLLVAMCLAEISIHRTAAGAAAQPSPVSLAASR